MLDKRVKPGQQWALLIFPIPLTYTNKLVHSATEMTPKEASKQENELNVYVNLKLKATRSHKGDTAISARDMVHIYTQRNH